MSNIIISSGVTSSGISITSGSILTITNGGETDASKIRSGHENDYGVASASTVTAKGIEAVYFGGESIGAKIGSGGTEIAYAGAVASTAKVLSGGAEAVYAGGTSWKTLLVGGKETVYSGGASYKAVVSSGGANLLLSGGLLMAQ